MDGFHIHICFFLNKNTYDTINPQKYVVFQFSAIFLNNSRRDKKIVYKGGMMTTHKHKCCNLAFVLK